MIAVRRSILFLTVFLLAFLIYVSILSSFYGSAKASLFFQSLGMVVFWFVLLAALVVSFFIFRTLRRRLGLLLIHLACVLVLAGAMWGSQTGHTLRQKYLGETRIYEGYLVLHEGFSANSVITIDTSASVGELPFHLALTRFSILYHPSDQGDSLYPQQYSSDVRFISNEGKQLDEKTITVNNPAVFGGYHFFQSSYGHSQHGTYSVLQVKAISGLHVVYAGYILLCVGLVWSLWIRRVLPAILSYKRADADAY
ncbi:MAG TPA: cytochrome c biogenesis protein ResB [Sedimentisphaerales bacterium]|nr:cytochrome c biogenesis protein ResB [Sedimentisphaerales bacterium]